MSEIGKTLKTARIEKGYTLDDLQQITKIQKRYLIAIEDENFAALPGDFYVKAFIKQYAETVGLDPAQFLNTFEQQDAPEEVKETPVANTRSARVETTRESMEKTNTFNRVLSYLPTIVIVTIVVIILGSIYFVAWNNHQKTAQTQQIESSSSKVSVSSEKATSTKTAAKKSSAAATSSAKKSTSKAKKSSSKKSATKLQLASNSGSTFTYNLSGATKIETVKFSVSGSNAWSAVSVNGTQQWQGTLSDGQTHAVTLPSGTTSLTINLGNSNATSLKINGKNFNFKKDNDSLTVRTLTVNVK
ncbi:helix-turn-helix domain-containing protein [Liquorilactobacillus satsumensis]|uniref:Transcriptional regulator n=1 Tax=Liquorilactobacillus satsumensis DSM 16230 = JCM 12392 TaxID=1423801 RepID=A0A0R1V3H1_9LACO|nr:helix-turn-helix domain-containing protein [Liquorilactobacillus satsumensis]KRL99700.1 transcriptional regulator [Liquorilactobacillus satsumensis DSM 16230 = JCM 12392]MCC7665705.1 DUF4115 domain-containing protein [Liquorilactobacillus satsumensis]MCP9313619.1 DUF4115 domain-containing protein [Liquorilactobacillus satsumensis]MCP9328283.1 DUF4115 domain-containing protein [Liquorilactobacillus satsumensis]MCP9356502.1 DUF4115 domain-containing protein [Liquorilactobacillus satsumensis]